MLGFYESHSKKNTSRVFSNPINQTSGENLLVMKRAKSISNTGFLIESLLFI